MTGRMEHYAEMVNSRARYTDYGKKIPDYNIGQSTGSTLFTNPQQFKFKRCTLKVTVIFWIENSVRLKDFHFSGWRWSPMQRRYFSS